jgi:hypothetical protein
MLRYNESMTKTVTNLRYSLIRISGEYVCAFDHKTGAAVTKNSAAWRYMEGEVI